MDKVCKYLNGKKTSIAAVLNLVAVWVSQKGWIDQNDLTLITTAITIWTGVAIGHKVVKKVGGK